MKRKSILVSVIIVAVFGAMGWKLVSNKKTIDSRKVVKEITEKIGVSIAVAEIRETSNQLELVGTAEADKTVMVAAESAGKIVQINFNLGDYVSKGAVLAKVDDTNKRLAVENAQLNYDKYKEDLERFQILRKSDAVSETQLRDMRLAFENASIQLENAKKQLEETKITAPFSGIITSKKSELGAYVNAGTSIAGMADIAQLKVTLSVSESNVYELHKGQEVSIRADVYPDVVFKGNISSVSSQGNAHTYPVEIVIPNNTKNPLKAGTYVKVNVDLKQSGKLLMIPRDAIVSSVKDPSVYVLEGENVKLTKITIGRDYESYLEVISGLNEGDKVVINGQINLTDGSRASIIKN